MLVLAPRESSPARTQHGEIDAELRDVTGSVIHDCCFDSGLSWIFHRLERRPCSTGLCERGNALTVDAVLTGVPVEVCSQLLEIAAEHAGRRVRIPSTRLGAKVRDDPNDAVGRHNASPGLDPFVRDASRRTFVCPIAGEEDESGQLGRAAAHSTSGAIDVHRQRSVSAVPKRMPRVTRTALESGFG